ncbi:MAG: BspA family leucine-rich repeat surface protein [Mogibacterium sp.]|nr:BspA family leucine-rich repeat surface protein [Mogibacterium sp.]
MKENTFKKSSRLALFAAVFTMLLAFAMLMPLKAHAATEKFNADSSMDWQITSSGVLQLGKAGEEQTWVIKSRQYDQYKTMPWYPQANDIKEVKFMGAVKASGTLEDVFRYLRTVEKYTNLQYLDVSQVHSMTSMFDTNPRLRELDLSSWKTDSLKVMSRMFYGDTNLKSIKFGSGWNTSQVTTMAQLFLKLEALEELDLSMFDTSNVTSMNTMFQECRALKKLDISGFNTEKVTDFYGFLNACVKMEELKFGPKFTTKNATDLWGAFANMELLEEFDAEMIDFSNAVEVNRIFFGLRKVKELNITGLNTKTINPNTGLEKMFWYCEELETIHGIEDIDVSQLKNFEGVFQGCKKLKSLDLRNWDLSNATNTGYMFDDCVELEEIKGYETFNTENVTKMSAMFRNCKLLKNLNLSRWDTSKVEMFGSMFAGCEELESLDISGFDMTKAINIDNMFNGCAVLETLKLPKDKSKLKMKNLTTIAALFAGCKVLPQDTIQTIVNGIHTEKCENISDVFNSCEMLESIDISHWKTEGTDPLLKDMHALFCWCKNLKDIKYPTGLNTKNVKNMFAVFVGCEALEKIDVSWMDTSSTENMRWLFRGTKNLTELKGYENLDTSNCTNMEQMFRECGLENIDVSKYDTSKVENMALMFYGSNAKTIDMTGLNTSKVENFQQMFDDCDKATEIKGYENFNTESATNMRGMFNNTGLETIDVSNYKTSNVKDMGYMFNENQKLKEIKGLDNLDTSKVKIAENMFSYNPVYADTAALDLVAGMENLKETDGVFQMATGLENSLKAQMGAEVADALPSPLKEQVKEAAAKIDAVFAEGSESTPEEIKAMTAAAKAAIANAAAQLPASAESAMNDLTGKKTAAETAIANDPTSAATLEAVKSAVGAAEKAKELAEAEKARADVALAQDPTNAALKAAADKAAENLTKAQTAVTDLAKTLSDAIANKEITDKANALAQQLLQEALAKANQNPGTTEAQQSAEAALKAAQDALAKAQAELALIKMLYGENSPQAQAAQAKVDQAIANVQTAQNLVNQTVTVSYEVGTQHIYGKNTYQITAKPTATGEGDVMLVQAKNAKSVSIPKTVTLGGQKYDVSRVAANSFQAKKIKKVTLGANVEKIDSKAFNKSKATTLVLKTKLLTKKSVKGSLKGAKKLKTVQVKTSSKKKMVKKYKKIFTAGNAGRKATVK